MSTIDEHELRCAWDARDYRAVVTGALVRYGPEIGGFLRARLPAAGSDDAYSKFSEDLLRGVPGFQWRCTLRAWVYCIARNAAAWWLAGQRLHQRIVPAERSDVLELAARIRSVTAVHLRTDVKSQVRQLREELVPIDQELLILRVDKALSWEEVAVALAPAERAAAGFAADALRRETARLRKRFQLITGKLRTLARERGLLAG